MVDFGRTAEGRGGMLVAHSGFGSQTGIVPHQARIETACGQHGQDDNRGEGDRARSGIDAGEFSELHQCDQDRLHENIDHRPSADGIDDPIQHGAVMQRPVCSDMRRNQQDGQSDELQDGHRDAGEEHQCGQRPHPDLQQFPHPAEDRAGLTGAQPDDGQDGVDVRRDVKHDRGERERPGALDRGRLAVVQAKTAPRAPHARRGPAYQTADVAADAPAMHGSCGPVRCGGVRNRASAHPAVAGFHRLPHRLVVERVVGQDHDHHQPAECEDGWAEIDGGHPAEANISDEQAQQIDFHHGPGTQILHPGVDGAQFRWWPLQPQSEQDGQHAKDAGERRDDGGDQHDQRDFPQAIFLHLHRAAEPARRRAAARRC